MSRPDRQKSATKLSPRSGADLSGLLLLDKPAGCTSHDVVQIARRALRQRKIGHCGTLDPAATGLLLLTVGRGTRLTRFLIRAPKVYEGGLRFGITTDTYDADGTVTAECSTADVALANVEATMKDLEGTYLQTPPPYSAKKKDGKKYYELARQGLEVPSDSSPVEVFELSPLGDLERDRLRFRLECSSGTYARSLVHDVGQQLGCGAHLEALQRVRVGDFELEAAATVERLEQADGEPERLGSAWIPFDEIQLPFEEVAVDAGQERRLLNGQTIVLADLESNEGDWLKLRSSRGRFLAVGTIVERIGQAGVGVIRPRIVFN